MKKIIELKGLDCPNCASKIEESVSKINNVSDVKVNFLLQKMTLDIESENVLKDIKKIVKKIEPDCEFIVNE